MSCRRRTFWGRSVWAAVVLIGAAVGRAASSVSAAEPSPSEPLDRLLEAHWQARGVVPAPLADDAELLRRVTLDLVGRPPTVREAAEHKASKEPDKHAAAVRRLLASPDFSFYFATVLDDFLQTRQAGAEPFVDYLRQSLAARKSWETLFRELLAGGADARQAKAAALFVEKRQKDVDQLTVDVSRAFFGVDVSCARCHDHPLVADWTQFHYYGLAAFLQPTPNKAKPEEPLGEVKFQSRDGRPQVARRMFLSGRTVDSPAPADAAARRAQLVDAALADSVFFRRALVNRLWALLLGRGLVEPVDQLHSNNPSAVPGALEWLGDDFASNGYDLRRTLERIATSRAYRASSRRSDDGRVAEPTDFAVMRLRPLSPRQLAFSLSVVLGDGKLDEPQPSAARLERLLGVPGVERNQRLLEVEAAASGLGAEFDPATSDFQSSTSEALFVTNAAPFQRLLAPSGDNLAARLIREDDVGRRIERACIELFQRPPDDAERSTWTARFAERSDDRAAVVAEMLWVLAASAEFRFNH